MASSAALRLHRQYSQRNQRVDKRKIVNYSHLGRTQLSLPSLVARETLSSLGVGQLLPLGTMCGHMTLKANVPNRIDILIPGQLW